MSCDQFPCLHGYRERSMTRCLRRLVAVSMLPTRLGLDRRMLLNTHVLHRTLVARLHPRRCARHPARRSKVMVVLQPCGYWAGISGGKVSNVYFRQNTHTRCLDEGETQVIASHDFRLNTVSRHAHALNKIQLIAHWQARHTRSTLA